MIITKRIDNSDNININNYKNNHTNSNHLN